MRIHLLRHADAENFATTDSARALTEKGRAQALQVAAYLQRIRQPLDVILTSPYVRAAQTAQPIADQYASAAFKEERRLKSGMLLPAALEVIQEYADTQDLLLVGHEPDLGFVASSLLSGDRSLNVEFGKASLLTLTLHHTQPTTAVLQSFLRIDQM
jgi:phosphohistidine phosphatase